MPTAISVHDTSCGLTKVCTWRRIWKILYFHFGPQFSHLLGMSGFSSAKARNEVDTVKKEMWWVGQTFSNPGTDLCNSAKIIIIIIKFTMMFFCLYFFSPSEFKTREEHDISDPSLTELQDSRDRWPIRVGWLKRELNLMPHFLSEMRQALWAWPLPKGSLSFYSGHRNLTHRCLT